MTHALRTHVLPGGYGFLETRLPDALVPDAAGFGRLWDMHPADFHLVRMPTGKIVPTPRWQQAYGRTYRYTGSSNSALPVPPILEPFGEWARGAVDPRLDGYLPNWYDARLGHYIGAHHDDVRDLVPGSPIVTIIFGENRPFRIRPPRPPFVDFAGPHGTVFVMPWATNEACMHEVPRHARHTGRRVSITLRAFRP